MLRTSLPVATLLLAACATEAPRREATPTTPARNVLADIRNQAAEYRAEFQVELIRDPAITDAIEASKQAEMRGDRAAAEAALVDALYDPEAKQRYAELLLARGEAAQAETLAREAFEASAKVGEWCARSWLTVAEARVLQNAPNGAAQARSRVPECKAPHVDRF